MADSKATADYSKEYEFVLSWLETIDSTPGSRDSTRPTKRRKTNKDQHHIGPQPRRADSTRRRSRNRIPTPSNSSSSLSPASSASPPVPNLPRDTIKIHNMAGSSRKRTRSISDVDSASASAPGDYDDQDAPFDPTPKASRKGHMLRGWRQDSRSGRSTPSLASSSMASGASSPTKQFRYAAKQDTGFQALNFEPNIARLPPSLQRLRQSLASISFGQDILPLDLQPEVQELGDFPSFAFYDPRTHPTQWRIPPTALVRRIVKRAVECDQDHEGESSWNMDVHSHMLDFAFRDGGSDLIDYRYWFATHPFLILSVFDAILTRCSTGAKLVTGYRPKGASSKAVDFCVCLKPPESSTEAQAIESCTRSRPGLSINHTDWGNFCKHPIALSIETKRQSEWDRALLQIGTWHSAQWRALQFDAPLKAIDCLPGVVVQGHSWCFVASTLEDGRSKLYHKLDIGGTDSHFAAYKLVMALQCLASWIDDTYWPAFKADILGRVPS
ncbi:hypothetical protein FZEAL_7746 [Fusarium zealandicum]|uniref:PD-(D/E)XK nuclease-like domain-containing protein n=1 Tax=Fusarium zealandicum TaxID=1053134 RepID=A0A8H4UFU7_9HYPO|nr:hypothetical protein FZEAL_7746 [Fusarium zealandicum]